MSILVIDSDVGSRAQLKASFNEQGFTALHMVESAAQAEAFITEHEQQNTSDCINLIIISNTLADADAFEVCRKIRASKIGASAYILMIVSSAENKTAINKAKRCGADDYAVKPYNSRAFLKQLVGFTHKNVVLLIEDDPVIRQLVSSLLCRQKIELVTADDGTQAYNLINSMLPPRLVLMDIGLPGMSGLKLVEHIRSKPLWKRTPVLMLTASTDVNDVKKSLASGANDYIAKPFDVAAFSQRMKKYFPDEGDVK